MTVLADAPDIRQLADGDLAEMFAAADDQARDAIVGELGRRDGLEQDRRRREAQREEWESGAYAQMLQAERECNGNLVSRRGVAMGITDWSLWSGPESRAIAYATEELRNFWDAHPRVTVTDHREQIAAGRRIQRDERDREAVKTGEGPMIGAIARDVVRTAAYADRHAQARQRVTGRAAEIRQASGVVATREPAALVRQREPVDGDETLEYAYRFLDHMCVFPSQAALVSAVLWCGHAHARDAAGKLVWLASPRLLFSSAEPGSGKSHAMELVAQLCPSPAVMVEPTMPALVASVGTLHDTVAIDEVDVFFGGSGGSRKQAARAIINAGYSGTGCYRRMHKGEPQKVPCFGAMMMAGLSKITHNDQLEATLSRCIKIMMKRAGDGYRPPRFDRQAQFAAQVIAQRMSTWSQQNLDDLAAHVPEVPGDLKPREAELWEPLLTVADLAGGEWPQLARAACEEMVASGGQPPEDEERMSQLEDIMNGWASSVMEEG